MRRPRSRISTSKPPAVSDAINWSFKMVMLPPIHG
jgi:hypothetical protein